MDPVPRRAARLIALDANNRVLLLQYARPNGEKFWATPGGGLEPDETFEMAALREAAEELGVRDVQLEPLWEGVATFQIGGRSIHQEEKFFLLGLDALRAAADVQQAHRLEGIIQTRWWTLSDLRCTEETVFPDDLASRVAALCPGAGEPDESGPQEE